MNHLITLEEHTNDVNNQAAIKILKHTPQLFIFNRNARKKLIPFGSSVIFKTKSSHYLATAHHCVNQNGERVNFSVLNAKGIAIPLTDDVTYAHDGDKEKVDIALMKLSDPSVRVLSEEHLFLDYSDIWKASILDDESEFIIAGYPQTGTKINPAKKDYKPTPLVYVSYSKAKEEYEKLGFDKRYHTLLAYHRRKSTIIGSGVMSMGPIPNGMSGGGFWKVKSHAIIPGDVQIKLAGIMYLHLEENQLMVGGNSELLGILMSRSIERYGP